MFEDIFIFTFNKNQNMSRIKGVSALNSKTSFLEIGSWIFRTLMCLVIGLAGYSYCLWNSSVSRLLVGGQQTKHQAWAKLCQAQVKMGLCHLTSTRYY